MLPDTSSTTWGWTAQIHSKLSVLRQLAFRYRCGMPVNAGFTICKSNRWRRLHKYRLLLPSPVKTSSENLGPMTALTPEFTKTSCSHKAVTACGKVPVSMRSQSSQARCKAL